jgi:hypothetical protein
MVVQTRPILEAQARYRVTTFGKIPALETVFRFDGEWWMQDYCMRSYAVTVDEHGKFLVNQYRTRRFEQGDKVGVPTFSVII